MMMDYFACTTFSVDDDRLVHLAQTPLQVPQSSLADGKNVGQQGRRSMVIEMLDHISRIQMRQLLQRV